MQIVFCVSLSIDSHLVVVVELILWFIQKAEMLRNSVTNRLNDDRNNSARKIDDWEVR